MHIFIRGAHVAIDDFPIVVDCERKGEGHGGACLCMWDGSLGGILRVKDPIFEVLVVVSRRLA